MLFMNISDRIHLLVHEKTRGNGKKFAEKTRINPTSLHYYLKGRLPKADALKNISDTYQVNLNWLICGTEPKYLETKENIATRARRKCIQLLEEWLEEFITEDPRNEIWFERQLERTFPEFNDWKKKKETAQSYLEKQHVA
ncbi:MAG: hypothetical protein D3923_16865 [Candidatus Electrothrix sp. AR3]|nr:hypothetical protein [Candidatus Electrothrix sp. AR3]